MDYECYHSIFKHIAIAGAPTYAAPLTREETRRNPAATDSGQVAVV